MRLIYILFLGIIVSVQAVKAQTEVPITTNDALIKYQQEKESQLPKEIRFDPTTGLQKRFCQVESDTINYVNAGDTISLRIRIDTTGLDTLPGNFTCLNCDGNPLGMTSIENDTFTFIADLAVQGGFLEFEIEFCNPNGCNSTTFPIIARRLNRSYFLPEEMLAAEGITQISADASLLPGVLDCNRFIECADDYQGKEQLSYFTTYSEPDNEFIYRASRYAGLDSVCVVLCDNFAICDTFHYAFRIQKTTIGLPFMDDFSYAGPFPSSDLWLDLDPYINNDMAENPPSLGVATFDGLNSRGEPHGGDAGASDFLTSNYMNLSNVSGPLHLTFWLQKRGLVDRPEVQDSMVVEFKTGAGNWIKQVAYEGSPASQPLTAEEPFHFYSIEVEQAFRHDDFQFRFKNLGDRQGIYDTWHLDYVRLSEDVDSTFEDVAFTELPAFLFNSYTSLPKRHLEGREEELVSNLLPVRLFNHSFQSLLAGDSQIRITEQNSGQTILGGSPSVTLLNNQLANITNGVHTSLDVDPLADFSSPWSAFIDELSNSDFGGSEELAFETRYTFVNTSQITSQGYELVNKNDTVSRITVLDNYFAYDDGTAETGLITQENTQLAVQFNVSKPDVLRAIRLHFPHTAVDITDQEFELKVWIGELDNEPEYSQIFNPYYVDLAFDSLQGFTTYPLVDDNGDFLPLDLPAGDFYVGWEQITDCNFSDCIPVGYDRNRPQGKPFIFRTSGQEWEPLSTLTPGGALMIRPVVGDETPGFTPTDEAFLPETIFKLFPNPATETVNLLLSDMVYDNYNVQVFNSLGQEVYAALASPQLSVQNLVPGIYFVKLTNRVTQEGFSQRLVVE